MIRVHAVDVERIYPRDTILELPLQGGAYLYAFTNCSQPSVKYQHQVHDSKASKARYSMTAEAG